MLECELQELAQEMISIGNNMDGHLLETVEALRTLDLEEAQQVAQSDEQIDIQEHQVEKMCLNLIVLQQSIAGDSRMITACLEILTGMECVAGQYANICEIITGDDLNDNSLMLSHMVRMLEGAHGMFRRSIDVFTSRDVEEAKAICQYDDVVDSMFSKIILEICNVIMQNP